MQDSKRHKDPLGGRTIQTLEVLASVGVTIEPPRADGSSSSQLSPYFTLSCNLHLSSQIVSFPMLLMY